MSDIEKNIEDIISEKQKSAQKIKNALKEQSNDLKLKNHFEGNNAVKVLPVNNEFKKTKLNYDKNMIVNNNENQITKKDIINHLRAAKGAHMKWMSYVQILFD
jgi:hypothetical protein